MDKSVRILQSMPLFNGLTAVDIEKIASVLKPVRVMEGENISTRGNTALTFYIVISGNYMVSFEGGQATTLHSTGEFFGFNALVTLSKYMETCIALTDGELYEMDREDFLSLIQGNAEIGVSVLKNSRRIIRERLHFLNNPVFSA